MDFLPHFFANWRRITNFAAVFVPTRAWGKGSNSKKLDFINIMSNFIN